MLIRSYTNRLKKAKVKEIFLSSDFAFILDSDGVLRGAGNNDANQLFISGQGSRDTFTPCGLANSLGRVQHVSAGRGHTGIAVAGFGTAFIGHNEYGQCGTGNFANALTPSVIRSIDSVPPPHWPTCGECYSFSVTLSPNLPYWSICSSGKNDRGQLSGSRPLGNHASWALAWNSDINFAPIPPEGNRVVYASQSSALLLSNKDEHRFCGDNSVGAYYSDVRLSYRQYWTTRPSFGQAPVDYINSYSLFLNTICSINNADNPYWLYAGSVCFENGIAMTPGPMNGVSAAYAPAFSSAFPFTTWTWLNGMDKIVYPKIGVGLEFVLYIKNDGTMWGAGRNTGGVLGTGNEQHVNGNVGLVQIPNPGGRPYIDVSCSEHGALMLCEDDTVWCIGNNAGGRFGIGSNHGVVYTPTQCIIE